MTEWLSLSLLWKKSLQCIMAQHSSQLHFISLIIWNLLYARHYSKYSTYIDLLISHNNPLRWLVSPFYGNMGNVETEVQREAEWLGPAHLAVSNRAALDRRQLLFRACAVTTCYAALRNTYVTDLTSLENLAFFSPKKGFVSFFARARGPMSWIINSVLEKCCL